MELSGDVLFDVTKRLRRVLAELVSDSADADARIVSEPTSQLRVFGAVLRLLDRLGADGPVARRAGQTWFGNDFVT